MKAYGELPENAKINETDLVGEEDGECTFEFGEDGEVDIGGGDQDWSELRVETVECEVPIVVWPGNTAFRPLEVVFDV